MKYIFRSIILITLFLLTPLFSQEPLEQIVQNQSYANEIEITENLERVKPRFRTYVDFSFISIGTGVSAEIKNIEIQGSYDTILFKPMIMVGALWKRYSKDPQKTGRYLGLGLKIGLNPYANNNRSLVSYGSIPLRVGYSEDRFFFEGGVDLAMGFIPVPAGRVGIEF